MIIALHDQLYTGILRPYLWTEHPYVPHVGLGPFVEERDSHDLLEARPRALDPVRYDRALREAEALDLDHSGPFESVHIVGSNDDLTHVTPLKEIRLSSS